MFSDQIISGGTHVVSVHITAQANSPYLYTINGGVAALNLNNTQDIRQLACGLPVDRSLATGSEWTCTFTLP